MLAASLLSSLQSAPDCLDVPVNPPVFLQNRKSQRYPCDDFYNLQYQYKVLPLFPTLTLRTLSLYTALNTRYKLGVVIGLITYLPLLMWPEGLIEPPEEKGRVVNSDTPLLHINGADDDGCARSCHV